MAERHSRRKAKRNAPTADPTVVEQSQDLAAVSGEHRPNMSSAEAQARYLAALAAQAYSDEQMRLVTSSHIVGDEDIAELKRSLAELPADQVKSLLTAMATNPAMLGEDTLAELASILGRRSPSRLGKLRTSVVPTRAIAKDEQHGV